MDRPDEQISLSHSSQSSHEPPGRYTSSDYLLNQPNRIVASAPSEDHGTPDSPINLMRENSNMRKHTNADQAHAETARKRVRPSQDMVITPDEENVIISLEEYEKLKWDNHRLHEACHKRVLQQGQLKQAVKEHEQINEKQKQLTELSIQQHANTTRDHEETASELREIKARLKIEQEATNRHIDKLREHLGIQMQQSENERAKTKGLDKDLRLHIDQANIWSKQLYAEIEYWKSAYGAMESKLEKCHQDIDEDHQRHEATAKAKEDMIEKMEGRVADRIKELRAKEDELHSVRTEAEMCKKDLDARLAIATKEAKSAKSASTRAANKARKESDALNAQIAELQKSTNQLDKLRSVHRIKEGEWNETKRELLLKLQNAQGLHQRYNRDVDDSVILKMFSALGVKIRRFVDKHTREVTIPAIEEHLTGIWVDLMPNLSATVSFLRCPMHLVAFEAYLWRWVAKLVFEPDSGVWAGQFGRDFYSLCSTIHGTALKGRNDLTASFHHWRSSSCFFIYSLCGQNYNTELRTQVEDMVKGVACLCGDGVEPDAVDEAMDIVKEACSLDIERRLLKACVRPSFSRLVNGQRVCFGMTFDDNTMCHRTSSSSNTESLKVDLIISPALLKSGNNDGTDYHQKMALKKMDVICDAKRLYATQTTEHSEQTSGLESKTEAQLTPKTESLPTDESNAINGAGLSSQQVKTEKSGLIIKSKD